LGAAAWYRRYGSCSTPQPGNTRPSVYDPIKDRTKLRGAHRLFALVPASQKLLIEGDFRNWNLIEAWARNIAHELAPAPAATR
jgi:hypothetical protein